MNTLITGGHGFLGTQVRRYFPDAICPEHWECDLTSEDQTKAWFSLYKPDTVVHLAAEVGGIGANREQPGRFFFANLQMGLNVLEACRIYNVRKLVMVGTVCAYPKHTPTPFREEELWNGYPEETNAPYGVAKRALLVGCQAYRQQYGLNSIYLLPTNLYGPMDNFQPGSSHVIPALIYKMYWAMQHGEASITLWGDGSPTREFLHVKDAARAIKLATNYYNGLDPINLGSGNVVSIKSLAIMVASLVGYKGEVVWDTSMPNGQPLRKLDTTKALEFGFESEIMFVEGLRETVEWYMGIANRSQALLSME